MPERFSPDRPRTLALALALLGLSACAGDPAVTVPETTPAAPAPSIALPETLSLALVAERPGGFAGFTVISITGLSDLKGLDSGQVALLFGSPTFTRRDPPARLWRFADDRCLLDLFLYPGRDGLERVVHAEVRGRSVFAPDPAACLVRLQARKETG